MTPLKKCGVSWRKPPNHKPTMRIKLTQDLPIAIHHGAMQGTEFDVIREDRVGCERGESGVWFIGLSGEECKALTGEYDFVSDIEH